MHSYLKAKADTRYVLFQHVSESPIKPIFSKIDGGISCLLSSFVMHEDVSGTSQVFEIIVLTRLLACFIYLLIMIMYITKIFLSH